MVAVPRNKTVLGFDKYLNGSRESLFSDWVGTYKYNLLFDSRIE